MKLMGKRIAAHIIDAFLVASIVAICKLIIEKTVVNISITPDTSKYIAFVFLPLYIFRDIVFRNASIGKKIMGLAVYDNAWQPPKILTILKRDAVMLFVGMLMLYKIFCISGGIIEFFNWEMNVLGTRVVEKKVYAEFESIAKNREGKFAENMSELYSMYLKDLYS